MVNQVGGKMIKMEDKKHPINRIIRTEIYSKYYFVNSFSGKLTYFDNPTESD